MQIRVEGGMKHCFAILCLSLFVGVSLKAEELGAGTDLKAFLRDEDIVTFALLPMTERHSDRDISVTVISWIKSCQLEMSRGECSLTALESALSAGSYYEVIALSMASAGTKCQGKIIDALRKSMHESQQHNALAAYAVYSSFNFGKNPLPAAVKAGKRFLRDLTIMGFDRGAIARVPNFVKALEESIEFERRELFSAPKSQNDIEAGQ